jgi:CheY-like chemotaxis protein
MKLVLIIEDNEKNMKLARDVLQVRGYETTRGVTGEEGVQLAKREAARPRADGHPAPGINGIEAFRQIRADAKTARHPVVALHRVGDADRPQRDQRRRLRRLHRQADQPEGVLETVKRLIEGKK